MAYKGCHQRGSLAAVVKVMVLVGNGYGTLLTYYSPSGYPIVDNRYIDNVWATMAVKGGLVGMLSFGVLLLVSFMEMVRAVVLAADERAKLIWRSLALAFPGFVVVGTVFTAHLLVPAVIVVSSTFLGMATATAQRGKTVAAAGEAGPVVGKMPAYK